MPALTFHVYGRVQGVGFRWWTRSQALRLDLGGTVRNLEDGSVEVRARGSDDALAHLRDLLRQGPPTAHVERVDEQPTESDLPDHFRIEH